MDQRRGPKNRESPGMLSPAQADSARSGTAHHPEQPWGGGEPARFDAPEDVTIRVGFTAVKVVFLCLVVLGGVVLGAVWVGSGFDGEMVLGTAMLALPLWLMLSVFAVQLRAGLPGAVVCRPDGLRFTKWFRRELVPWPDIRQVDVEEALEAVGTETESWVRPVYYTRIQQGSTWRRLSNRGHFHRDPVDQQVLAITSWRDHATSSPDPARWELPTGSDLDGDPKRARSWMRRRVELPLAITGLSVVVVWGALVLGIVTADELGEVETTVLGVVLIVAATLSLVAWIASALSARRAGGHAPASGSDEAGAYSVRLRRSTLWLWLLAAPVALQTYLLVWAALTELARSS